MRHKPAQVVEVLRSGGLPRRVHGKLRKPDVNGLYRHKHVCNTAERGAARHVGAVCKALHPDSRLGADAPEHGGGNAVGRIVLICVVLHDDTAAYNGAVECIGIFRMIRVLCVSVVGGDEEALRKQHTVALLAVAQRQADAPHGITQKRGRSALLRCAADLLVVEHTAHGDRRTFLRIRKALHAAEGALEIVKLRGKDKLAVGAELRTPASAVQEQIRADDALLLDADAFRNDSQKAPRTFGGAVQRQGVDRSGVLHAVVCAAVHVYRNARNDEQVTVNIHELRFELIALAHDDASCDAERSVKPRRHEHTAVLLGAELNVCVRGLFGVLLDLEGGGIAVRRRHHKAGGRAFWDAEGDDRGTVAADEILAALPKLPALRLRKLGVAEGAQ